MRSTNPAHDREKGVYMKGAILFLLGHLLFPGTNETFGQPVALSEGQLMNIGAPTILIILESYRENMLTLYSVEEKENTWEIGRKLLNHRLQDTQLCTPQSMSLFWEGQRTNKTNTT